MKNYFLPLLLFAIILLPCFVFAQVSGTVYQDFNANGALDTGGANYNDAPYAGVTVTAYDATGTVAGTAVSIADGTYTIAGVSGQLRVEFTYPTTAGMLEGASGGTAVQFVSGPVSGVNYAVSFPGAYCQDNPYLTTVCYQAGPNQNGANDTEPAGVRWSYNNSGLGPDDKFSFANISQLGSTSGGCL